jgi:hypothetical protein
MEEQVEETMLCAEKIHPAELNPFLYSKIAGRLKAGESIKRGEVSKIKLAFVVIIIILNIITLLSIPGKTGSTNIASPDPRETLAKEYLFTNEYNLY